MSTNRTKIDWAYRRAERFWATGNFPFMDYSRIREIAGMLRRAEKRGRKNERILPVLTVAGIRACKAQLISQVQKETERLSC